MSINIFSRNIVVEKNIDLRNIWNNLNSQSIELYLDVLCDLVKQCNSLNDSRSNNRLFQFMKYDKLDTQRHIDLHTFNNEEIEYINKVTMYIKYIRSMYTAPILNKHETIDLLIYEIENISEKHYNLDIAKRNIECKLRELNICSIVELKDSNLYVHIPKYDHCICLIRDIQDTREFDKVTIQYSVIVNGDIIDFHEEILKHKNIYSLSYRTEQGSYILIQLSNFIFQCQMILGETRNKVDKINDVNIHKSKILGILIEIDKEIKRIKEDNYIPIFKADTLRLDDIKRLRIKIKNYSHVIRELTDNSGNTKNHEIYRNLEFIADILSMSYNKIVNSLCLDENVYYSLSEIKCNNTLYIRSSSNPKTTEYAFGEENLTSILASNLRCLYKNQKNINIQCEAMVGNGRSDIRLAIGNQIFGILESKLIKEKSNIEQEVLNAIDQLYSRYSENNTINGDMSFKLYLILFTHDKEMRSILNPIYNALQVYANRNELKYNQLEEHENSVKFQYINENDKFGFKSKIRTINLIICNLEINYKRNSKQRSAAKNYNIQHQNT
jgi:hypothetical protein